MRRTSASLLLLVLGAVHLAPLFVLVQFHMDRAHIERELCVQREVMADMRTCHGECQLSKRFRVLEQKAAKNFPTERIESRFEPKAPLAESHLWLPNGPFEVRRPDLVLLPLERAIPAAEPVPWGRA
ncbi:MAG: hypothetical protein KF797_14615 [Flavobacteriales bacterium]|nr:hypothetical protein [Flavobacteriales bacterium]